MTYPHWIYEVDEQGNGARCHFDGTDWFVVIECRDGRRAASNAPARLDAIAKARLKLGLPCLKAGPKLCGEPVQDPVAILHRAIRERNAALRAVAWRLIPPWEWVLAGAALAAFAGVAWVYAP